MERLSSHQLASTSSSASWGGVVRKSSSSTTRHSSSSVVSTLQVPIGYNPFASNLVPQSAPRIKRFRPCNADPSAHAASASQQGTRDVGPVLVSESGISEGAGSSGDRLVPQAEAALEEEPNSVLSSFAAELDDKPAKASPWIAALSLFGVAFLLAGGFLLKDQIKGFLTFFIDAVDDWGHWGYLAYAVVYIGLEVLCLPAIPLTMTAGIIFGTAQGTIITSAAGTIAAALAFLIARYAMRDKVRKFAYSNPRFKAIDRAIGSNGLKFVTLLRLSPLLPLAASNYLYGVTSVDLGSYVLGSWIGMLPGTYAYVHAGYIGRAVFMEGEGALPIDAWQVALGLGATLLALGFVGQLAKRAIEEVDKEESAVKSFNDDVAAKSAAESSIEPGM